MIFLRKWSTVMRSNEAALVFQMCFGLTKFRELSKIEILREVTFEPNIYSTIDGLSV